MWARRIILALFVCAFVIPNTESLEELRIENDTDLKPVLIGGQTLLMSERLMKKLEDDKETFHWRPWQQTRTRVQDIIVYEVECIGGDSVESFPDSVLTEQQILYGGFLLYVLFGVCAFTMTAMVCNDYFIPCVELICEDLKIPPNIAAATFMAVATSCPEFFVNLISTFLTESDLGIGTIVGSAIFNTLGVTALGGLAAIHPIAIDRLPLTRDAIIYSINISVLVAIVWDGVVVWYEAMVLGILYVFYFIFMFNSTRLFNYLEKISSNKNVGQKDNPEKGDGQEKGIDNTAYLHSSDPRLDTRVNGFSSDKAAVVITQEQTTNEENSLFSEMWKLPKNKSVLRKIWWSFTWPLNLVLMSTIPNPIRFRKFYPLAFFMCIVWIGVNSYFVSWCMTVIGHTFLIPDSVMGMTFLAFGGCLPEACSIIIMSRQGKGSMGVSNALGANSLAILFALGLPWLVKTLVLHGQGAEDPVVRINSVGIEYIVGTILVAVAALWVTLCIGKFTLRKIVSAALACFYVVIITFAILLEMGIIIDRDIPFC